MSSLLEEEAAGSADAYFLSGIRTYSVVTLNEECGFIQWVPNTMPIRPIILKYYAAKGIEAWVSSLIRTSTAKA